MASAFGHAALGATLGKLLLPQRQHWPWWVAAAACAVLPDIDFLGFKFGVPYASIWGHRGLTHSLLAAAVVAGVGAGLAQLLAASARRPPAGRLAVLLFLATASHGVLDALTNGGLGVAFFSPWNAARHFFPWHPHPGVAAGNKRFCGRAGLAGAAQRSPMGGPALPDAVGAAPREGSPRRMT